MLFGILDSSCDSYEGAEVYNIYIYTYFDSCINISVVFCEEVRHYRCGCFIFAYNSFAVRFALFAINEEN